MSSGTVTRPERLTRERVVATAASLLDRTGSDGLTLTAVAGALGVRTPSLYHHFAGLDGLRAALRHHGVVQLGDALLRASSGRAGRDALAAVARAYVDFGRAHPGLYVLTLAGDTSADPELAEAAGRLLDTVAAVLRGYGIEGDEALHATRYLRSTLHGFVALEAAGGFALALDLEASQERLVTALDAGLRSLAER